MFDPLRRKPRATAIVLGRDGNAHTTRNAADKFDAPGGTYVTEGPGRFWVDRPIPRGWLSIYTEGNPQPLNRGTDAMKPTGFFAADLELLTGGFYPMLFGRTKKGRGVDLNWKLLMYGGGGLLVAGYLAYSMYQNGGFS